MHDSIHPKPLTRSRRARLIAAAALASAVLVAGCGGSSASPPVAAVNSTTTSTSSAASTAATSSRSATATTSRSRTATGNDAAGSGPSTPAALESEALAYSKCMRANGEPNFPDPEAGGGFVFQTGAGIDPSSPQFKSAQAKCQKLMPVGIGPGTQTHPSAQALTQMVKVAQCMRRHGVSNFPDPRTTVPPLSSLHGGGVISDIDGVILVFPGTIDEQSPLFTRAAAVCAFPLHNH